MIGGPIINLDTFARSASRTFLLQQSYFLLENVCYFFFFSKSSGGGGAAPPAPPSARALNLPDRKKDPTLYLLLVSVFSGISEYTRKRVKLN